MVKQETKNNPQPEVFQEFEIVINGKAHSYQLRRPSPNHKKAVFELMKKYDIPYEDFLDFQMEMVKHGDDMSGLTEKASEVMKKISSASFKDDLEEELFSIWAQKPGQGYSEKSEEEKSKLKNWYADNGTGVSLFHFFGSMT